MKKGKIALFALLLLIGLVPTIIAFMFPPENAKLRFEDPATKPFLRQNPDDPNKIDTLEIN